MMRYRDTIICAVCVLMAGALFFAAGQQLDSINAQRQDLKLIINQPLENAPPSLAFATVAMGAFRGLVVDILWMRADMMKEQGKFFDAKQLAEWISLLQPRFSSVWEFQAWNMAYNISVAIPASQPEQRWRWVRNGYELLRDKGIHYNPKALILYRELARIFQHKIGGVSDDAHKYYKIQLAREIGPLIGGADANFFEAAIAGPQDWNALLADPNCAELVAAFKQADPAFQAQETFARNYLTFLQRRDNFSPDANDVLTQYAGSKTLDTLDTFTRVWELRTTWKMDVAFMHEMNKRFGPVDFDDPNHVIALDWRHPDAHAIYWAAKGLSIAAKDEDREIGSDEINTDRIIIHSLQNLFRYGRIHLFSVPYYPLKPDGTRSEVAQMRPDIYVRPDLRMFDRYNDALLRLLKKYKGDYGRFEGLSNGHRNMLKNAVLSFYQARQYKQAMRIYKELQQRYPRDEFKVSLAEFARHRFIEEIKDGFGIMDAREQIMALLKESFYLYAMHSDDDAFGRQELAKEIHNYYQGDEYRIDLPDMKTLYFLTVMDFLVDKNYPQYVKDSFRARIYNEQPELYKQFQEMEKKARESGELNLN